MRIEPVTTLAREATRLLEELTAADEPILITRDGMPAAYLVAAPTYERLQQRLALLSGIASGERAIADGHVVPHASAKRQMARWLK